MPTIPSCLRHGFVFALFLTLNMDVQAAPPAAPATNAPARPAAPAAKRYSIEQFMATTRFSGASFSKDGSRILFHSNASGVFNLYAQAVAAGAPVALTQSKTDSHFALGYFPDDDRVLYTRDQGGNELNHLYVRELDGSERDLTPGEKLKARFHGWSSDGKALFVSTNERDPRFFDVYRYAAKGYARDLVFKNEPGHSVGAVSQDGRFVALSKAHTTADADVYLYDSKDGSLKLISPHQGVASFEPQSFTPDGKQLLMTSNEGSEFTRLLAYDIGSGKTATLDQPPWDVAYAYFSRDGHFRVTGVNVDGSIAVTVRKDGQALPLPKLPGGEIRNVVFSDDGRQMAFYLNGDRAPNNLFVHDFARSKTTQLTQSLPKDINPNDLVEGRVVRFKSFDGMVIPSVYYEPKGASPRNKVPALVWVHGGPGGQTMRGYSALMQYFANHGYAVLGINNRGSSGYGKSFFTADDGKHGREPLWDVVEAKTYLASTGVIDHERVAIIGGSYGGYMTLAAMSFRPEVFKAGIDIFGVSNWVRTLESIPAYWEASRAALYKEIGDPVQDREFLVATSPLFHAKEIRRPLLVVQGANDPRVIQAESDDIVAAVKKNGVPVEYIVFPDEGHGFRKKANEIKAYRAMLEFLDKYLKP